MLAAAIPRLRACGRKLVGDSESGDDLAQDTVIKAWAARNRLQVGANFNSWPYTILRNQFLSQMRRKRFMGEWSDAVAEAKPCAAADQDRNIHVQDVQRTLDRLPAARREAQILVGCRN
jgi:RNA polymerase sigma-70 factor (ECF subfamily)